MKPQIVVAEDAQENGLATMVADLLQANLDESNHKKNVFLRMKGVVALVATDAEMFATLVFDSGRCDVHDGVYSEPDLRIFSDSESILELSLIPIVHGVPYYLNETGKSVAKKLLTGEICIGGMLLHPRLLTQLTIVLSVN